MTKHLTESAQRLMEDLVVNRGLSYAEAIAESYKTASRLAAPHYEVARFLEREIERQNRRERDWM